MKKTLCILILLCLFALSACNPPAITPTPSSPTETEAEALVDRYQTNAALSWRDYTQMWHRNGVTASAKCVDIRTGYYGMEINPQLGIITAVGALKDSGSIADQLQERNSDFVSDLSTVTMGYSVFTNEAHPYIGITGIPGSASNSRILESGTFMQRMDMLYLKFRGLTDIKGRLEIAALPDAFTIELALHTKEKDKTLYTPSFNMNFGDTFAFASQEGNIVKLHNELHKGFVFILPEGVSCTMEDGKLTFTGPAITLAKGKFTGMTVTVVPTLDVRTAAQEYLGRSAATAKAVQITPKEGKEQETYFDAHGYMVVDMNRMYTSRTNGFTTEQKRNQYDRLSLTLTNNSSNDITLPVQLLKDQTFAVEGMTAILRDIDTGEPIGIPVQTTKNWHGQSQVVQTTDASRSWEGTWYHGYTMIKIPANSSVTYEVTIAYANWGGVYAASHAQLCLAGWGGGYQQWETSAVGSFGENFCYDMEMAHSTGAFINDVLPLLTYGQSGNKYTWSNGCSGGNFLVLYNTSGRRIQLKGLKSRFAAQGPCLTEVVYTGITEDESIAVEYRVNMGRSNDAAKALHSFKYTFLKDVSFSRLAFYAIGSDNYNVSHSTVTIGTKDGPQAFSIGDQDYGGTFTIDYSQPSGYMNAESMQRIELEGDGLFAFFEKSLDYEPQYGVPSNRMLNVLSYNATLNGNTYTNPAFSIRLDNSSFGSNGLNCTSLELSPQAEVGDTIKAGSVVEGTVEFIPLPVHKGEGENGYYGDNQAMLALSDADFSSYKLAMLFVQGDRLSATATVGTIVRDYPLQVACDTGQTAAELTVTGGMGYVPISFTGLSSYSGNRLYKKNHSNQWELVDQSVHGNDYWQCILDPASGTYAITFNLLHSGDPLQTYTYKLVKES